MEVKYAYSFPILLSPKCLPRHLEGRDHVTKCEHGNIFKNP